jgi:predicted alpha/beta superfamily hydrolase
MRTRLASIVALLVVVAACALHARTVAPVPAAIEAGPPALPGRLLRHAAFPSQYVAPRNVDVWLPPGYTDSAARYPVLYMHDGQNLFDAAHAYGGVHWGVAEAIVRLAASAEIRPAIVVGIWSTPARLAEYMPRKALDGGDVHVLEGQPPLAPADIVSDDYLAFITQELKPFVDSRYRTAPAGSDTFVMGSSMGGLAALYAVAEYPQVFGAAAAISTHWPAGGGVSIAYFGKALPPPGTHRFYFDFGTATLDAGYAPYQSRMDAAMRGLGYREGVDWTTRRFEGAEHSERAWRQRIDVPLRFLLGGAKEPAPPVRQSQASVTAAPAPPCRPSAADPRCRLPR